MSDSGGSSLRVVLEQLKVPSDFAQYDKITEVDIIVCLEEWKRRADSVLSDVRAHLRKRDDLSTTENADVVSFVVPLAADGPWTSDAAREQAQEILLPYALPDASILQDILSRHVKPIFQSNTHPSLNPSSGRTLPRPAGGPLAQSSHLEGQVWKEHPGIADLVSWCVQRCESNLYEKLWHLIIPPVMTLLDDFEPPYKLHGINIVSDMLVKVPADLLRRTGVDGLLFTSLKTCLTFLHNPETPDLLRAATRTLITLVLLTTSAGSARRFDQLCAILGDGIIGNVWLYATRESDAIEASLDVLPEVVQALGIGAARYLKAIIPQLVHPLLPSPENAASRRFQLASVRALSLAIRTCAPRMFKWKDTILEGVLKCWVSIVDEGGSDDHIEELKRALGEVCRCLLDACPSLREEEYARLVQMDANMFGPLLASSIDCFT
ncbi:hypothetical protein WOLCODRAFT_163213 [Wolfiporia cocos MD-104 SS10]|uniref:ARM repeat-containing protein n=1 Tax=Wolfiporia cocos (strain MD-104) TaxID=742152 RepID=A0A2H3JNU2_WOLCO|nr:hypothetical protein WOLCODRAFT_163213 [Wolfiporia cocos MD-104 SS10]